jgi:ABC-type glutathione transport system ATPase component
MGSSLSTNSFNSDAAKQSLLRVQGLSKKYVRGGLWQKRLVINAVDTVNFEIMAGQTLALVGQSGSGKSTVARCITRLESPDSGEIVFGGTDIAKLSARDLTSFRSRVQMVFQDAATALNPHFSAFQTIEEPLLLRRKTDDRNSNRALRRDIAATLMTEVGISPDEMQRSILHFSGGQCQRLALARALALRPELLVLDEALTGLDLSTQAQIANLLVDLQVAHRLTYLLISHDMALVARLADSIAVMSGGRIVEAAPTQQIISDPTHAATRQLVAAANSAASNLSAMTSTLA